MKPSRAVKPVSYLKAHAAELIRDVVDHQRTLIITQRGEAKVVVQDVQTYEDLQESLALLKMLAQSKKSVRQGRTKPLEEAFRSVRAKARTGPKAKK